MPTMHVHAQHMQWLRRVSNGLHADLPIEVNSFLTRKMPLSESYELVCSNALLGSRDWPLSTREYGLDLYTICEPIVLH
jgi:hypothetical protein